MLDIIVAMTKDRVIGKNGRIPWHIKEDMALFKELTTNNVVIMGRTTWQSLPDRYRPLPDRINIVVSSTLSSQDGATVCDDIDEAMKVAKTHERGIFCIGGAQLYKAMLPLADMLHVSCVNKHYDGDAYFPEVDFSKWREVESKTFDEFTYRKYVKDNNL